MAQRSKKDSLFAALLQKYQTTSQQQTDAKPADTGEASTLRLHFDPIAVRARRPVMWTLADAYNCDLLTRADFEMEGHSIVLCFAHGMTARTQARALTYAQKNVRALALEMGLDPALYTACGLERQEHHSLQGLFAFPDEGNQCEF